MLYLIGIGLKPDHLTSEAIAAAGVCDEIYLEYYTSRLAESDLADLQQKLKCKKKIVPLSREDVEGGISDLVLESRPRNVGILVIGNPLIATTHIEFLLEAKNQNAAIRIIPGISVYDLVPVCGLDAYKFGRVSTVVFQEKDYSPESFFDFISGNHDNGLHSLCLLDIRAEIEQLMTINQALEILEKIAEKKKQIWFSKSIIVGLSGLSHANQKIMVGTPAELREEKFELFPQSLIVCGKLNGKEKEALQKLHGWKEE
ncbi:MAG: diphthine synthase [Candidatus Micrarchaeota archaeon]